MCRRVCQVLEIVGYAMAFMVVLPFIVILLPVGLVMWLWDKIVECAKEEKEA